MSISSYFVLLKRNPSEPLPGPVLQLPPVSILELTSDGMAFIWPVEPNREDLCLYCDTYQSVPDDIFQHYSYQDEHCQPPVVEGYPCNFVEFPGHHHQDLSAYLLDGDCMDLGGYYLSLRDFRLAHEYDAEDVLTRSLGIHRGIASARAAWKEILFRAAERAAKKIGETQNT